EGEGHDGDHDHDQRHEARPEPAAGKHRRERLVLFQIVGEELGDLVAELLVRALDGLQAELELPLLRDGLREGADQAGAVGEPAREAVDLRVVVVAWGALAARAMLAGRTMLALARPRAG